MGDFVVGLDDDGGFAGWGIEDSERDSQRCYLLIDMELSGEYFVFGPGFSLGDLRAFSAFGVDEVGEYAIVEVGFGGAEFPLSEHRVHLLLRGSWVPWLD